MFETYGEAEAFRARCHAVRHRGLSAPLLVEALSIGPQWLDEFEKMSDDDLRAVSALWAQHAAA